MISPRNTTQCTPLEEDWGHHVRKASTDAFQEAIAYDGQQPALRIIGIIIIIVAL